MTATATEIKNLAVPTTTTQQQAFENGNGSTLNHPSLQLQQQHHQQQQQIHPQHMQDSFLYSSQPQPPHQILSMDNRSNAPSSTPSTASRNHRNPARRNNGPQSSYTNQPNNKPLPPPPPTKRAKLQCLVLGAAAAGKTSILRRYFHRTFEQDARVATLGSDFYIGQCQVTTPVDTQTNDQPPTDTTTQEEPAVASTTRVNLQLWDTPGRERFYLNRKRKFTASLSDSFFRQADAVMLVYDMNSSTSFTQLLRWYADLIEIKKNNEFPILIVGNKLDLFLADQQRATTMVHPRRVPQRKVLRLPEKYGGQDLRYEYRVSSPIQPSKSTQTRRASSKDLYENSYLATRENWTTDNSYLDSLLNSEDASSPDRDMVLLWCMRNGLAHHEASAATGEGIDEAFESMLRLALQARERQEAENDGARQNQNQIQKQPHLRQHQQEIDFQDRYAEEDEPCCFCFRPLPQWNKQI